METIIKYNNGINKIAMNKKNIAQINFVVASRYVY